MKKQYTAPTISVQTMQLGVYGDYGSGDGGSGPDRPIRVVDRFDLRME
jgi:hypothetical protein